MLDELLAAVIKAAAVAGAPTSTFVHRDAEGLTSIILGGEYCLLNYISEFIERGNYISEFSIIRAKSRPTR